MVTDRDGVPKFLQKLVSAHLIPVIQRTGADCLHLAGGTRGPGAAPAEHPSGPRETHPFVELCFGVAGEAEVWAGTTFHKLAAGDVLIIPPGMVHSAAAVHAAGTSFIAAFSRLLWVAVFPCGCVLNLCESAGGVHSSTPRRLLLERHVNPSIQGMLQELRSKDEHARLIAACQMLEALAWLCRGREEQDPGDLPIEVNRAEVTDAAGYSVATRAKLFLEQNFDADLDLDTIAQAVGSTKSHLCREFKAGTGLTVVEYLTKVRIEAARRLLLTDLTIHTVSRLAGFQDPYYFSRVFRKATKASPSEFRSRHDLAVLSTVH